VPAGSRGSGEGCKLRTRYKSRYRCLSKEERLVGAVVEYAER